MGHIFTPNWITAYACDAGEFYQEFGSVREFCEVAKVTSDVDVDHSESATVILHHNRRKYLIQRGLEIRWLQPLKRFGIRVNEQEALARICIWLKRVPISLRASWWTIYSLSLSVSILKYWLIFVI
jgi:hypothetical protein